MADLFASDPPPPPSGADSPPPGAPLADRLRPARLEEVVGQEHLTGPEGAGGRVVAAGKLSSMILWGPPGTGKTTIARVLADAVGMRFVAIQHSAPRPWLSITHITTVIASPMTESPQSDSSLAIWRRRLVVPMIRSKPLAKIMCCLVVLVTGACSAVGDEPPRRAASVSVPHLSVEVAVAPADQSMAATAVVRPGPVSRGQEIGFVLARSLTIHSVDAIPNGQVTIGESTRPWSGLQRIAVRFPADAPNPSITVRYSGRPADAGTPPINMINSQLVELSLDGMWVPIREDLGMRFTSEARISGLPEGFVVVAQGEQSRQEGDIRIVRRHPDLDLAIVASPNLRRRAGSNIELYAADPNAAVPDFYFQHGQQALHFLSEWLGALPVTPVRIAVVSRLRRSGYARAGYIVVVDMDGATSPGGAGFIAHELSHLWFSNANAAMEHRWLDESISEYVALRYIEAQFGEAERERLLTRRRERAATAGPIIGTNRGDRELYAKGPLLLMDLEQRIGRATIDRLIARVARERIGTTGEFLTRLAELTSPDVRTWFDARLRA